MTVTSAPNSSDPLPAARLLAEFTNRDRALARRRVVLLVGTDDEARDLAAAWTGQSIELNVCADLLTALLRIGRSSLDVAVIGANAGAVTAGDFLRALRGEGNDLPVIVGVDETQRDIGVDALTAGATAIVRRRFDADDLLRILSGTAPSGQAIPIRPLPIDVGGRLRVDGASPRMWLDGQESLLPPVEYLLLRYLASRPEEILSREELFDAVWGSRGTRVSNTLTVHLARLRRRLHSGDGHDWIRPIRGFGYQFLAPHTGTTPA
jgi:DNA-binding response OmpR family regulator